MLMMKYEKFKNCNDKTSKYISKPIDNVKKVAKRKSLLKGFSIAALAGLAFCGGVNNANADEKQVPTGTTLEEKSAYTFVDNSADSNTGIAVEFYKYNDVTYEIESQTKYVNIKKDTYANGTISYSWDNDTKTFTATPSGAESKIEGVEYVGNLENTGGAIQNHFNSSTEEIKGNFIANFANSKGGAVSNSYSSSIDIFVGNFIGNTAGNGGAISNCFYSSIENLVGDFIGNSAINNSQYNGHGGAIYNFQGSTITDITGDFINNSAGREGGAIYNDSSSIGTISGNFINNTAEVGGAVYNSSTITGIFGDFIGNSASSDGGAIFDIGTIINPIKGSFIGNTSGGRGGAIYTLGSLTFLADGTTSVFKDNEDSTGSNAIYAVSVSAPYLKFIQNNSGKTYMYDKLEAHYGMDVHLIGDGTGTFYMYNDMINTSLHLDNITVDAVNNQTHTYNYAGLLLESNSNFVADVDLQNEVMDHIETGNNYTVNEGAKLTVTGMNLLNDATKDDTKIFFAESGLAKHVDTTVTEVAYSPIYKYDVNYVVDEEDNQGYFTFARHAVPQGGGGNSSPSYESFNPAVLTSNVTAQAGAQSAMNQGMYYAFEHADNFMNMSFMERTNIINENNYALSTDFNQNLGSIKLEMGRNNKAVWVKPYTTFESIDLKNGPKVDAINYGTIIGFDSDIHKLKKGWVNVGTAYIGYNGAQLKYTGVDTSTNGGILGLTETFYKGNFWTALTVTAGAGVAESSTIYGHEDMTSLMAGIASKTGYNFEFKGGKFIIQPRMFMSYSFINTFDYRNAAGVKIDSDPLHTIQLNPSVKFIENVKGWQPYVSVGMVWNLLNETKAQANGVKLPEMHVKPYVEYGVGLQKTWNDKYAAYGQAMLRNGGRKGVALSFGFRMALGEGKAQKAEVRKNKTETNKMVTSPIQRQKKVLKQLSDIQKAKLQQTSRTAMNAVIAKI